MAISITNLTAAHSTTNRTSTAYTTASLSFIQARTYLLGIRARVASGSVGIGSITDAAGNTWSLVGSVTESNITIFLYSTVAAATASGAISITPDGLNTWTQAGWIVDEIAGAGPTPIVQSATNSDPASHSELTVTLASFADATNNVAYGFFAHNEDTALTAGTGFSDLGASAETTENANRIKSIWKTGEDTGVDVTVTTTTADIFGIAVEIADGPAFPQVADITSYYGASASSHDVTMPATVVAGQMLVALLANDDGRTYTMTGWTELGTGATRATAFAKIADGSEAGGTATVGLSSTGELSAQVYRITGAYSTIADGAEGGTATGGTSSAPNPPAAVPSWGSENNLWIAFAGVSNSYDFTSAPSGYTDLTETNSAGSAGTAALGSARRELNSHNENPGNFSGSASKNYATNTVVIRPAAPAATITDAGAIASAESFGTPTLRANISPAAIGTGEAFGDHELQAGAASITPDLIASAESFGDAELLQISVISLQGFGIASEEAFGVHELQPGAATISPDAIATAESFGSHNLQAAIRPGSIISTEAFSAPYFISHILPSGIVTAESFGTVILLRYIRPDAIGTGESFGTAELQPGTAYISPTAIATLESFGLHRLAKALAGRISPPPGLAGDGAGLQPGVSAFRVNPPSGQSKSGLWLPPGV